MVMFCFGCCLICRDRGGAAQPNGVVVRFFSHLTANFLKSKNGSERVGAMVASFFLFNTRMV